MLNRLTQFFLETKLVTFLVFSLLILYGVVVAPFSWDRSPLPANPVPVDAIPNYGENQQIVFTAWPGRSPQDVEDQISYPLTTALLGVPGVRTVRSSSMLGFSSIYLIFEEDVELYWSRSRILEKLNALPSGLLPKGVQPTLGPDATALGQVFWYTLEGRDSLGNVTGGWGLDELRTIQDYYVKYGLLGADGVAEVGSVGGFVKEYQVDVDPAALRAYGLGVLDVADAVEASNLDVGAQTIESNRVEYLVRGLGYLESLSDLEQAVIEVRDNVPIRVSDVAHVGFGPAPREGILDKSGAEVVGGVVVARDGENPLQVIKNVKARIAEISTGLPRKTLEDGTVSQLTIVPFYDRTQLIEETLGTLEEALTLEILITILVVVIMVFHLRASVLISGLLPVGVLLTFIAMKHFGIDANIVALSGIAIAIGTMVDLGIILTENVLRHLDNPEEKKTLLQTIGAATKEVNGAIVTAVATTIVSFLPVFSLTAAEGKLFHPLAYTKTFALISALLIALFLIPAMAHVLFGLRVRKAQWRNVWYGLLAVAGGITVFFVPWLGIALLLLAALGLLEALRPDWLGGRVHFLRVFLIAGVIIHLLARTWFPLGPSGGWLGNLLFVGFLLGGILGLFWLLRLYYTRILRWCLEHKALFLSIPLALIIGAIMIWRGFDGTFGFLARGFDAVGVNVRTTSVWSSINHTFPGLSKEFMPSLDEGAFLYMPTSMPHAGVEETRRVVQKLDMAIRAIPEVDQVVGKAGRAQTPLDPAPMNMFEIVISYLPEYRSDPDGHRLRFKYEDDAFVRDAKGELVPDPSGEYFRQWRDHIRSPQDIWDEVARVTQLPGVTSAPKLQPIETRLIMLQTGMRADVGIKVHGPNLETIESFGFALESILKDLPSVNSASVYAERVEGKPYLHINWNREALARYGITIEQAQMSLQVAVGGVPLTTTVEGRERFPVRVRYPRELRDSPDALRQVLIPGMGGVQVPVGQLAEIEFLQGPMLIRSEDTFLTSYVTFESSEGLSSADAVAQAQEEINRRIADGRLVVAPGVSYEFSGNYENQKRAEARLAVIVPICLVVIFLLLYLQFRKVSTSLMVFSGVAVAFAGGFWMIWLYGQDGFLDLTIAGLNLRDLFQIHPIRLSVAVWVGFIALFGIATDDGVLIATYLDQTFKANKPTDKKSLRAAVVEAGNQRVRPALMTSATTILALLPVLTSTGRGSDVMVPMAIPAFGGMTIELITLFVVPTLYCWVHERALKKTPPTDEN